MERYRPSRRRRRLWDAAGVRALRLHLGMTQQELARELNVRQQTVSEWETGAYRPRGASERLLGMVAEGAGFRYGEGRSSLGRGTTAPANRGTTRGRS